MSFKHRHRALAIMVGLASMLACTPDASAKDKHGRGNGRGWDKHESRNHNRGYERPYPRQYGDQQDYYPRPVPYRPSYAPPAYATPGIGIFVPFR